MIAVPWGCALHSNLNWWCWCLYGWAEGDTWTKDYVNTISLLFLPLLIPLSVFLSHFFSSPYLQWFMQTCLRVSDNKDLFKRQAQFFWVIHWHPDILRCIAFLQSIACNLFHLQPFTPATFFTCNLSHLYSMLVLYFNIYIYIFTQSFHTSGCNKRLIFFKAESNRFEIRVFLLLDWLLYHG